jgi:anti-sigma factor RsiW
MISCDNYQATIVALFDNQAKDDDLRVVARHLQDCSECRAFCLDLVGIRRTVTSASVPSLSSAARQEVLDSIKADQCDRAKNSRRWLRFGKLGRWAAILVIGALSIACFTLSTTAKDLRTKLGAAEQQVAAIHEQAKLAESEERQQKAISALYFRMAELEERVNRSSRPERASLPAQVYDRPGSENNL